MIEIKGKYNTAKCFTGELEEFAAAQIRQVCDREEFAGTRIRIMPDVHAGKGCTIGTTMTLKDKVVPGMVGVDIGCGMETIVLEDREIDLGALDRLIHQAIPCGQNIRKVPHEYNAQIDLEELRCFRQVNADRAEKSIGTLGGGNHFIEVDRDEDGTLYLVIHSGSRHLGNQVASYYQEEGFRILCGCGRRQIDEAMARLKAEGRFREIQPTIERMKAQAGSWTGIPRELAYVEGTFCEDYIHDKKVTQHFAAVHLTAMAQVILEFMGLS